MTALKLNGMEILGPAKDGEAGRVPLPLSLAGVQAGFPSPDVRLPFDGRDDLTLFRAMWIMQDS